MTSLRLIFYRQLVQASAKVNRIKYRVKNEKEEEDGRKEGKKARTKERQLVHIADQNKHERNKAGMDERKERRKEEDGERGASLDT